MLANKAGHQVRIARAMQNPKLGQAELVARMQVEEFNISKNTLSRIETGQRYVTDLELIGFSRVLNVSTSWLLGETRDPQIK